ncbi:hypothetical protein OIU35_13970 [Boseaceae bacterium BT-24-1]|nr:hypothetical protein [Boseaceae bacterium BT-24-1]
MLLAALGGCAASEPTSILVEVPADTGIPEPLYTPDRVVPGQLSYAPDRARFPPVLTERFSYPTQPEANAAYRRLIAAMPGDHAHPMAITLFGCRPGALDAQTARITRYRGAVVHCATDFLDGGGRRLRRETANFYYYRDRWMMQPIHPPRIPVVWTNRESSPRDLWWWVPGRSRYQ